MIEGHGDDAYRYGKRSGANFSSNVWYGADLSGLKRHLAECLDSMDVYPEPDAASLAERLAGRCGVSCGSVCVTAGATEAFYLIARAFPGACSTVLSPAFSEYADACRMAGHRIRYVTREELSAGRLPDGEGLVWMGNPNNPDGRALSLRRVETLIENHPERIFVWDHSYGDFTDCPLLSPSRAVGYPHVIVVRSMTKLYGIAGLRLGYLVAQPSLARQIEAQKMPWAVNSLALEAGRYIVEHPEEFVFDRRALLDKTRRFGHALARVEGVRVYPSDCHFFLASLEQGRASELKEYLMERHGLLIRDASNFRGLDERFLRLSTQRRSENDRLVEAIAEWIRQ